MAELFTPPTDACVFCVYERSSSYDPNFKNVPPVFVRGVKTENGPRDLWSEHADTRVWGNAHRERMMERNMERNT